MISLSGLTGRLLGQLVDQWGALPPVSTQFIVEQSGILLPQPWERLSLDHVHSLEDAVQETPGLAYGLAVGLDLSPEALKNLGVAVDASAYRRSRQELARLALSQSEEDPRVPDIFRKISNQQDERAVLTAFQMLSRHDLNQVLWLLYQEGSLHILLNGFSSFLFLWGNKKKLVTLLTQERLSALTIPVRAAVVLAMQKGITSSVMEEGIANVMTGTHGEDLTRLKGILDRYSPEDLQKLVHVDIGSRRRRNQILNHITAEATNVRPNIRLLASDIDDTLYRNWADPRYPDDTVYPGVVAFYKALGCYHRNDWERRGPTFISARPGERTGLAESISVEIIRKRTGFRFPTVLSSNLFTLIGDNIARAKFDNFVSYSRLFPEFTMVLTGDNGQQDPEFCKQVIEVYPEVVAGAFIHNVALDLIQDPRGYDDEEVVSPVGIRRLFYYDTYIGAALAAYEMTPRLISLIDLQEVVRQALNDVDWIEFADEAQGGLVHSLLARDQKIVEGKYRT